MTEEDRIQINVAKTLDAAAVLWCHVANERKTTEERGIFLRRKGVKKGVQDVLIFTPPPLCPQFVGSAIEIKTLDGTVSSDQRYWFERLYACRWYTTIDRGYDAVISKLKQLGYIS